MWPFGRAGIRWPTHRFGRGFTLACLIRISATRGRRHLWATYSGYRLTEGQDASRPFQRFRPSRLDVETIIAVQDASDRPYQAGYLVWLQVEVGNGSGSDLVPWVDAHAGLPDATAGAVVGAVQCAWICRML